MKGFILGSLCPVLENEVTLTWQKIFLPDQKIFFFSLKLCELRFSANELELK